MYTSLIAVSGKSRVNGSLGPRSIIGLTSAVALQGRLREGFHGPRLLGVFVAVETMYTSLSLTALCRREQCKEERTVWWVCTHSHSVATVESFNVKVRWRRKTASLYHAAHSYYCDRVTGDSYTTTPGHWLASLPGYLAFSHYKP